MNPLKKLAGETAIYGISSILARMLNFLLVPIYTGYLVPAEYGIVTELYAYVAFLNVVYTYGMETAYFRYASSKDHGEGWVYNNTLTLITLSSIALSVTISLLATPIVDYLGYPGREHYVYWFSAILAIDAIVAIPFAKLRREKKPVQFATAKIINISLTIFLNLFFIVFCREVAEGNFLPGLQSFVATFYDPARDVDYIFLSNLLGNASLFILLWRPISSAKFALQIKVLRPMLIYAYPLIFMGLAGVTNEMFSRITLKEWLPEGFYPGRSNLAALGIFGACYKLSIFMLLVVQAFRYAAEPFFFSQAADKDSPKVFSDVMHYFIIACCLIFLGVSLNLDILGPLFLRKAEYLEGIAIVPILLLANMFLGIYYNLSIWFKLSDKTYYGTWITVAGAVITLAFNYLLIPILGYTGSAITTLICYFSMTLACYYYGNKYYFIPYRIPQGLLYIAGSSMLYYLASQIDISNQFLATSFHMVVILAFICFVFITEKDNFREKEVEGS